MILFKRKPVLLPPLVLAMQIIERNKGNLSVATDWGDGWKASIGIHRKDGVYMSFPGKGADATEATCSAAHKVVQEGL